MQIYALVIHPSPISLGSVCPLTELTVDGESRNDRVVVPEDKNDTISRHSILSPILDDDAERESGVKEPASSEAASPTAKSNAPYMHRRLHFCF